MRQLELARPSSGRNHPRKSMCSPTFGSAGYSDTTGETLQDVRAADDVAVNRDGQHPSLAGLYDRLLSELVPAGAGADGPIAARVERVGAVRAKQREVERIKSRLAREKQFNKRVVINAKLRDVTKELKRLGGSEGPEWPVVP